MALTVETYDRLDDAGRALETARGAQFLGGGTLVMRAVNYGDQSFTRIVRSTDQTLNSVRAMGDRIEIGAGVTMRQVMDERDLVFLTPAARSVGGPAVRTTATVGGNLFAAHPYGDFAVAALALEGVVTIAGGRMLPLEELLRSRDREPRQLVRSLTIRRPADRQFRYLKVSRVRPKGVSVMSMAAWLPQSAGRVSNVRVAYGAMAATPVRVPAVERALEGKTLDEAGVAAALAAATEGLDPPTDPLASRWYRKQVAPVHLKRLLLESR